MLAAWAPEESLLIVLSKEKVVAAISRTLHHVRILVTNLLPFKSLAPFEFIWRQKSLEVHEGNGDLALGLGAHNRELRALYASFYPRKETFVMVDV